MSQPEVDQLNDYQPRLTTRVDLTHPTRVKHPVRNIVLLAIVTFILAGVGVVAYAYQFINSAIIHVNAEDRAGFIGDVYRIFNSDAQPLRGETDDRINILLLGRGGEGHDGADLVDTIMIASFKPSTKQLGLFSFPRDLVVPIDQYHTGYPSYDRINTLVSVGGVSLAKETIEQVTGLKMHYYVLVDFTAFKNVIDRIGGVNVNVTNSFTGLYGANELSTPCPDTDLYEGDDGMYCEIEFTSGSQRLDGERALIFARLRKLAPTSTDSSEGGDFARAKRQQQILEATRDEVLKTSTWINPVTLSNVLHDLGDHVDIDIQTWELVRLAQLAQQVDQATIVNRVVDNSTNRLVQDYRDPVTGAALEIPTAGEGDYTAIAAYAQTIFDEETTSVVPVDVTPSQMETASIWIENGSGIDGLGAQWSDKLTIAGLVVSGVSTAPTSSLQHSRLYTLSDADLPTTQQWLETVLDVVAVAGTIPQPDTEISLSSDLDPALVDTTDIPTDVDYVLVLGTDSQALLETDKTITTTPSP